MFRHECDLWCKLEDSAHITCYVLKTEGRTGRFMLQRPLADIITMSISIYVYICLYGLILQIVNDVN